MTEVHHNMGWGQSNPSLVEEEVVYSNQEYVTSSKSSSNLGLNFVTLAEEVPMIVIESNQVSAETDAPMIIVGNEVSEQMICAEEEVETESDMAWYSNPPIAHEETVNTQVESAPKRVFKRVGRVALPYLKEELPDMDIPLNDESYATYHPFPCDFCSRRFKKKANLMNHMVAHQTQRPHSCNICSSRFMRKCDLVNHQKIHSYVPNRENRDDIEEDFKYNPFQTVAAKKRTKKGKGGGFSKKAPAKKIKSPMSSSQENQGYFKPTSYVDEDVKLLLEMTNRLHEKSSSSDKNSVKEEQTTSEVPMGSEDRPYVCNKCGRCFARESALVSHSQIHAEDSYYECNKCGMRFFSLEHLRDHSVRKHDTPYTGETSSSSDEREVERGTYTGDERFGTFYCTICAISFHRLELLKQHKRIHSKKDENSGLFKCNTCLSAFTTHEKLLFHLETNVNCQRHVCLLCGEHYNDQMNVQKHIQQKHGRDLPANACCYCGKQCKDKRALQKHFWVHSNDKKYSCKKMDCMKKFHSWARLRRHMLSHNASKVVRCEECDEMFPDRRALINHRHSHFPDSSTRKFACNECGKSFGSRSSQQIHNRIHTGERPYGCRYCWKAFADGGTLRKHERIHTGEKPYVCVVCPRAFNQRVVLREHIRSHHSGSVTKPGFPAPVYQCPVCGVVASNSEELAVHLVKHSDDNTLKNRNPQPGIRTYKRRRKLSAYEYDAENEFDENDFFEKKDSDTESVDSDRESTRKTPVRKPRGKKIDGYSKLTKTFEAAMKNITSLVEAKPVKRAKMITTKPKPNVKKGKKGATKTAGRKKTVSVTSMTPTPRPRTRTLSGRMSGRKDSFTENTEPMNTEESRRVDEPRLRAVRPRTKNVSYEAIRNYDDPLPEVATFPERITSKRPIRKPAAFKKKESPKRDAKDPSVKTEIIRNMEIKCEVAEDNYAAANSEGYVCGICSFVFSSKADLLSHVPIHI